MTLELNEANRRQANTRTCSDCSAEGHSREVEAIAGAVVRRSINDRETGGQKTVLKTIRVPSGSSPVQKAGRTVFANQVSTRTLN